MSKKKKTRTHEEKQLQKGREIGSCVEKGPSRRVRRQKQNRIKKKERPQTENKTLRQRHRDGHRHTCNIVAFRKNWNNLIKKNKRKNKEKFEEKKNLMTPW